MIIVIAAILSTMFLYIIALHMRINNIYEYLDRITSSKFGDDMRKLMEEEDER